MISAVGMRMNFNFGADGWYVDEEEGGLNEKENGCGGVR